MLRLQQLEARENPSATIDPPGILVPPTEADLTPTPLITMANAAYWIVDGIYTVALPPAGK